MVRTLPALLLLASPAWANSVADDPTGLKVDAPPGYTADMQPGAPGHGPTVNAKKATDVDTGCRISFTAVPGNATLKQEELNDTVRGAAWQDLARKTLSVMYDLRSTTLVTTRDITGFVTVGDFKEGLTEARPRAKEVRTWFALQETPRGRTSIVCVGEKNGFEAREAEFRALLDGVTAP